MILVDTSIWVDHLRKADRTLVAFLEAARVVIHPFIIGELALGSLRDRKMVLELLGGLPAAKVATNDEVMILIERQALGGAGIGFIDAHLLASARLTPGASLWTRDRRLREIAARMNMAAFSAEER